MAWLGSSSARAESAERIVSLAPSVTEILFALGAGERIVGVSSHCDYPPAAGRLPRIGTFLAPNVELILAEKPDLVVGVPSPANRTSVQSLERYGMRVLIVDPQDVASILASVREVARAIGVPDAGEGLALRIAGDVERVRGRVAGAARRRVLMVVGRQPLVAAGKDVYLDEVIRMAGGANVAASTGERWPSIGVEFVLAAGPEVIIDAAMGSEASAGEAPAAFWGRFALIPAVRDGRVYGCGASELLRPGPRVGETLETVARFIHPERFAAPGPDSAPSDGSS